jgi:hypothetical protein
MVIGFVFNGVLNDVQIAALVLTAPFPAPLGELLRRIQEAAFGASVSQFFLGQFLLHDNPA